MDPEIYLIRHGETEWNAEGRFQGQLDSPLTQRGCEQAAQVGQLLARAMARRNGVPMHVSPLGRARATAKIVRQYADCATSVLEPRIEEVTTGSWDGLSHMDIDAGWPGLLNGSSAFDWYFRAPDGEFL
jgi:broad specificity phosphatase PhoE